MRFCHVVPDGGVCYRHCHQQIGKVDTAELDVSLLM
jgi:hypothetical protein